MPYTKLHLESLSEGYNATHFLWKDSEFYGLKQLSFHSFDNAFKRSVKQHLRLGQLAEQFALDELKQHPDIKILAENVQIKAQKQTLGELDALIKINQEFFHVEMVYKFYLYDVSLGKAEINRWVGPNRNDSLIQKIQKLKTHQLPLLYSDACRQQLSKLNIYTNHFKQRVWFKAQLFVPYGMKAEFNHLNSNCIEGFYISIDSLDTFDKYLFYLPSKIDWLLKPNLNKDWKSFKEILPEIMKFIAVKKSPLLWIKTSDKSLHKCFVVWW
ncbi:DUF1853 family protein [Psychroserpens sp. XS_ASV72]|uniref:DUF1853 family protein n=1 Tax=Psychroserpens sp. XS_ASV72 TaxID=3241293 RepID=UPI003513D9CF